MKVTLITMKFDGDFAENVGVGRIKEFLKQNNILTDIVYFSQGESAESVVNRIDIDCNIYGFSVYDKSVLNIAEIASVIKRKKTESTIFIGSKYVTSYYKEIFKDSRMGAIDYAILGDGEYSIFELIKCIENAEPLNDFVSKHSHIASKKSIDNKEPCALNVNNVPLPDRQMIIDEGQFHAYICDSHGCCNSCSFCTQGNYYNKWNGRTAESIYDEIKTLYDSERIIFFDFTGGSFEDPGTRGKQKIDRLCNYIINDGLKITMKCYLRANSFQDCEFDINILKKMKIAGFHVTFVGIESGNNADLDIYNKRTTVEQNVSMLKRLSDNGIYCGSFGFIMLNPYSTIETIRQNYEFLINVKSHNFLTYTSKLTAYLGTDITNKIFNDNLVIRENVTLHGVPYKFLNKEIMEIDKFLEKYFINDRVGKLMIDTDAIPLFLHQMVPFLKNSEEYLAILDAIMDKYFNLFKQFFKTLYIDNNISVCEKQFPVFIDQIKKLDAQLKLLKQKVIKDLVRDRVIHNKINKVGF